MIRPVLDTNTVLMPITRTGTNDIWLRDAWEQQRIVPLVSDETEAELIRTLHSLRFEIEEDQILNVAAAYLDYCERIVVPDTPPKTPECRDPNDQMFLVLAYQAGADYLVTRDDDLLVLKDESEIPIVTPSQLSVILQQHLQ